MKRGNPVIFDLPRQRDQRLSRPFGHSLQQSGMNFDVYVYFPRFALLCAVRFGHCRSARFCRRGGRANRARRPNRTKPASGSRRHGAEGERKPETETHSGACRAAPGTSDRSCTRCATGLAWDAAQCQSRNLRPGAQHLFTTIGTSSSTMTQQTIQALPGGDNTPVERILLQFPGVSQDSAASGLLHVRNDHAICNSASMAYSCPTARLASAAFSTPAGSAALASSWARSRPNMACGQWG